MNPSYAGIRILVAEDDVMIGDALLNMLRDRFACDTQVVHDGDAVLHTLETGPVELLITDMQMPGVHGRHLVEQVRKRWPDTDIIAMTAFSDTYPYVEIIRAGASDFVSKPFRLEEMEAKVVRVLEVRRQREALVRGRERILQRVKAVQDGSSNRADAQNRYRAMFELNMMPAVILDPEGFVIRDANRAFCELCGYPRDALAGKSMGDFLNAPSWARFGQVFDVLAKTGRGTLSDMSLECAGGRCATVDSSITFIADEEDRFVHIACKDVTEQKLLQQELAEMAARDELTGLYNQRALRVRLEAAIQNARATGKPLSLISIDLDNFKQCNDQFGHPVGDRVLRAAGQVILEQIRSLDAGFRNGGDEFCILLHAAGADIAGHVGERVRKMFQESRCYGTSMSVGVAEYQESMDALALVKSADEALYRAKANGKNTVCVA